MAPSDLASLPVFLPLAGAALAMVAKAVKAAAPSRALEYAGAFIGLALPWAALVALAPGLLGAEVYTGVYGAWNGLLGIGYRFDGLAWLVNVLGFSVAGAAWVYSLGAGPRGPGFTAIFLIQAASLSAAISTTDVFNLFVCLEVLGMASYVLVAWSEKPGAYLAAFSYLMVSAAAMVFFLLGVYGLYRLTGSLSYQGIAGGLAALADGGGALARASVASIAAAVALRVAVMPLYGWLPDAHALAAHAVSAVLSGVLIKTPLFALSRFLLALPTGAAIGELACYAGALTALGGVIVALSQTDAKRLLAYHSISQIGYVTAAWGAGVTALGRGDPAGAVLLAAAFLHALYHAWFKGLLFLSVGTATDAVGERDVYMVRGAGATLRAAGERVPVTMLSFAVGALAISAIPPLSGYASKTAIVSALGQSWTTLALTVASVGTVASFIKLSRIFWPSRRSRPAPPVAGFRPRASMMAAQLFLLVLCLAGGLAAPVVSALVAGFLGGDASGPVPSYLFSASNLLKSLAITSAGAALFGLALTKPGRFLAELVRERPRAFHGLFVAFGVGLAVMTFWLGRGS
ncbi:MAG: hypothetical protein JW923_05965 [Spirochaetales bacterium]|nr:hypothetical protein [Spirochaetales bacterium]